MRWRGSRQSPGKAFELLPESQHAPATLRVRRWSPAVDKALQSSRVSRIWVDRTWEDQGHGLAFLAQFAGRITRLQVDAEGVTDLSVTARLPNLEEVSLACGVESIDFATLPRLRKCLLSGQRSLDAISRCSSLEELGLFGVKISDVRMLAPLKSLRRLHLNVMPRLATLEGIERLPLERIELIHVSRLRSIVPLTTLPNLRRLELDGSRGVSDFARVGRIGALESLSVGSGLSIRSLQFLAGLGNLQQLGLGGLDVTAASASLKPLTKLGRLKKLGLVDIKKELSIEPCGDIAALEELGLSRVRVGPSIASLTRLRGLRQVVIASVKTIRDFESLSRNPSIEVLVLRRVPTLKSIAFLRSLVNLREVQILYTRVADGDLSVLLDLPHLRQATVLPERKHYSHTAEQIQGALRSQA